MPSRSLLYLALLLAHQPEANEAEEVVMLVSAAGSLRRESGGGDGAIVTSCALVPVCAQGCADTLLALDGERPIPSGDAARCTWLSHPERFAGKDRAKAVPIVLEHVRALSEKIRPQIDARMQDQLNCGLARLGLAKASPEACARTEARQFVLVVERFAKTPEGERSRWPLAHACYHLESCSGDCAEEIELLWSVDWSRFPAPDPQRVAAVKQCPEFGRLLLAGPVNETEQRARLWFNKRARDFAARACKVLAVPERARLACAMSRLGVPLEPSACGLQPDGCAPVSAKRK